MIVSVPPQHGKSLGSSVLLPAYALGIRPGLRIALASYNLRLASRFNRRIQQLIDSAPYAELFPGHPAQTAARRYRKQKEAAAPSAAGAGNLVRTAEEFDLAGQSGGLLAVGREGSLTGNTVDLLILDDLFKRRAGGQFSAGARQRVEWYNAVARTRLHNGSQELIVGTRWHEEDLPGRIAAHERVVGLTDFSQLGTLPPDCWLMLNFEAIKESPPTPADPRSKGEALWPARHSRALLDARRRLDPHLFEALTEAPGLKRGIALRRRVRHLRRTARDGGQTRQLHRHRRYGRRLPLLALLRGGRRRHDLPGPTRSTRRSRWRQPNRRRPRCCAARTCAKRRKQLARRGFARAVGRLVPEVRIAWTHQSRATSEARILSTPATVQRSQRWPRGWEARWPEPRATCSVTAASTGQPPPRRSGRADRVVETELDRSRRTIRAVGFRSPER
ncbi:MAG: terminase [Alistipes indistinctus]